MENLTREELIAIILEQGKIIAKLTERIKELEEQLNQNSRNSSKPPSTDGPGKPPVKSLRERSGRGPGGQRGHKGHGMKIDREPDEVIKIVPSVCCGCGNALSGANTSSHADTHYVYDAVIKVKLTRYDIHQCGCAECGTVTKGEPPPECKGRMNYGNMIRTLCIVMTNWANVGIDKTRKILRDLFGITISGGTVKSIQAEFASKTCDTIAEIKRKLLGSPILHADETGGRVNGSTQWYHTASNDRYTLITVHRKRGKEGSDSGGVLPEYKGTLIHDCWKTYFRYTDGRHALCCAHLLRELNAQIEAGYIWASDMKALLLDMKYTVDGYKIGGKTGLPQYCIDDFKMRYDIILFNARSEILPGMLRKKTKAENLLARFEQYHAEITRFAYDFDVPFDNNQAERDIRNIKVKQKVSGGFRTADGAADYADSASVIGTSVKFMYSVVDSVICLFSGSSPMFCRVIE